ncbi:hypothetical protein CLCR_03413 [Cladophialophora carrionii]|uniref:Uncharacterized protein n=1 Tax=Cladophialophora carrionii TaxID=86049 RepID=A0A1C1CH52_9EURO|nr:hypothetical protein CLCR_03413 [Cladophialophora carrionii]
MDRRFLFVESLPIRAPLAAKYEQQARARSHAATVSHRKSTIKPSSLEVAQRTPCAQKKPRHAWTAIYRGCPCPSVFVHGWLSNYDADVSDWGDEDTEACQTPSEQQSHQVQRTKSGPQSLVDASTRDPFQTQPVSKHSLRADELFDFAVNVAAATMFDIQPERSPPNAIVTTIQMAMKDAAAFHAALALFASIQANTHGASLSPEANYHKGECVRLISGRLDGSVSTCEGTIYAVILLWAFESTLTATDALQAHVNGLELMVKRKGGVSTLTPEVQCMLAWSIILNRGHFKLPFRSDRNDRNSVTVTVTVNSYPTSGTPAAQPTPPLSGGLLSSYHETWHFLSDLHWLSRSSPSLFQSQSPFFEVQSPLHRLVFGTIDLARLQAFRDPTRKNLVSIPRVFCVLWILSIFLEHARSAVEIAAELQRLEERLRRHLLDRSGSPMMLCWFLLRDEKSSQLHRRSWAVVRHVNLIKMWDVDKQRNLTALLHGYLVFDETTAEAQHQLYHSVMEGIMEDMANLT